MNDYVVKMWHCLISIEIKHEHVSQLTKIIAIKKLAYIWNSHLYSPDLMATRSDYIPVVHPCQSFICFSESQDRIAQLVCRQMFHCNCLSAWTESNKILNRITIDLTATASCDPICCTNIFTCQSCNRDNVVQKVYKKYAYIKASSDTEEKSSDVPKVLIKKKKNEKRASRQKKKKEAFSNGCE